MILISRVTQILLSSPKGGLLAGLLGEAETREKSWSPRNVDYEKINPEINFTRPNKARRFLLSNNMDKTADYLSAPCIQLSAPGPDRCPRH